MSSEQTPTTNGVSTSITPDTSADGTPTPRSPLTGGCLCKSVRYRIDRDQCQEQMRMNIIGLVVPTEAFQLQDPQNIIRYYDAELPDRPVVNRIMFCSKCGCYLFHEPLAQTGSMRIMTGTLDPDCKGYAASPSTEIHVQTRVNWINQVPGASQTEDYGQWPQSWQ